MQQEAMWGAVKSAWKELVLGAVVVAAASFAGLIFFAPKFQVGTDLLLVQNQTGSQDAYTLFKSLDYLGKVLNESVYSERFIGAVVETGKVDINFLPSNPRDRLEKWSDMVQVSRNADAGILHVKVLDDDQKQAQRVSQAVGEVLTQKNMLFRGGDEKSVEVRVLSGPVVERNPTLKEIAMAAIGGALLGAVLVLLWILMRGERLPPVRPSMPMAPDWQPMSRPVYPDYLEAPVNLPTMPTAESDLPRVQSDAMMRDSKVSMFQR